MLSHPTSAFTSVSAATTPLRFTPATPRKITPPRRHPRPRPRSTQISPAQPPQISAAETTTTQDGQDQSSTSTTTTSKPDEKEPPCGCPDEPNLVVVDGWRAKPTFDSAGSSSVKQLSETYASARACLRAAREHGRFVSYDYGSGVCLAFSDAARPMISRHVGSALLGFSDKKLHPVPGIDFHRDDILAGGGRQLEPERAHW